MRARALDWAHRRGQAFAEILNHLPTDHLHDKTAATVIVMTRLEDLRRDLARAAHTDTSDRVSAGQVRRLACQAGIIPAVLGTKSQVLDLGRTARHHNTAQRLALALKYDSCAAHGCDRPLAWCETHHLTGWAHGGQTDQNNLIPLCGTHHRWIEHTNTTHQTHHHPDHTTTIHFTSRN